MHVFVKQLFCTDLEKIGDRTEGGEMTYENRYEDDLVRLIADMDDVPETDKAAGIGSACGLSPPAIDPERFHKAMLMLDRLENARVRKAKNDKYLRSRKAISLRDELIEWTLDAKISGCWNHYQHDIIRHVHIEHELLEANQRGRPTTQQMFSMVQMASVDWDV